MVGLQKGIVTIATAIGLSRQAKHMRASPLDGANKVSARFPVRASCAAPFPGLSGHLCLRHGFRQDRQLAAAGRPRPASSWEIRPPEQDPRLVGHGDDGRSYIPAAEGHTQGRQVLPYGWCSGVDLVMALCLRRF